MKSYNIQIPSPIIGNISYFDSIPAALREGWTLNSQTQDGYLVTRKCKGGWNLGVIILPDKNEELDQSK